MQMMHGPLPASLEDAEITAISSIYYIPNFIDHGEEETLRNLIIQAPPRRWTQLSHRRLQSYPSKLSANNKLLAEPLPSWLVHPFIDRLESLPLRGRGQLDSDGRESHVFASSPHGRPNHVLINEYRPGQGIMPHEDGSAYWPVVATLSLLSTVVLDIYEKGEDGQRSQKPRWRVLQEPRSLLVTGKDMYINSLHGISDVLIDEDLGPATITNWTMLGDTAQFLNGQNNRDLRISLTYRDVLKVADVGSKLRLPGRLD